jgi:hypothetical protein
MPRLILEFAAAIALTLAAILTSVTGAMANDVMVMKAFARASATPVAKSGAAYVSVMNHGADADRLVAVTTPAASTAELHTTTTVEGVMRMEATGPVDIASMATLEMAPGGLHIMLMGLKAPLKQGESIEIMLTFEKAGEITVKVPVGGVAEGTHDHAAESSGG